MNNFRHITARVDDKTLEELDRHCQIMNVNHGTHLNRSVVIRLALKEYLEKNKQKIRDITQKVVSIACLL
jgi:metal-responsive CopG/Arc/MetJ family transcriptional regulator